MKKFLVLLLIIPGVAFAAGSLMKSMKIDKDGKITATASDGSVRQVPSQKSDSPTAIYVEGEATAEHRIRINATGTGGSNSPGYQLFNEGVFKGSFNYNESLDRTEIYGSVSTGPAISITGDTKDTIFYGAASFRNEPMAITVGNTTAGDFANATFKASRMGANHYLNTEEPLGIFFTRSNANEAELYIGGGTSSFNAMEHIEFRTAPPGNVTTVNGTAKLTITDHVHITNTPPTEISSNGVALHTSLMPTRIIGFFLTQSVSAATGWNITFEVPETSGAGNIAGLLHCTAGDFGGGSSSGNGTYLASIQGGQSGINATVSVINNSLTTDALYNVTIDESTPRRLTFTSTGAGTGTDVRHTCRLTYSSFTF